MESWFDKIKYFFS